MYEGLLAETVRVRGHCRDQFGGDDRAPSPEEVAQTEEVLKQRNKTYEFPHVRRRRPRLLRRRPSELPFGAGDRRLEEGLRLVRQVPQLNR